MNTLNTLGGSNMILEEIVDRKKVKLKEQKLYFSAKEFEKQIENMTKSPVSFYKTIDKGGLSIIGEIKKASPSKGIIKEDLDPVKIALEYEGVVDAISILTEENFFKGSPENLRKVSEIIHIPLLRKDFIIDDFQIFEARILGASCVLLITSILEDKKLKGFIKLSKDLQMEALVEVHTEEEVYRAIEAGARIIGINNRNLKDFTVDLNNTIRLRNLIPNGILVVSESGINTAEDIKVLREANIDGVLVGESFMRAEDISKKAKEFKATYEG